MASSSASGDHLHVEKTDEKVLNIDEKGDKSEQTVHNSLKDLTNFKVTKILCNNSNRKTICLQGVFKNSEGVGIVLLEKSAFEDKLFEQDECAFFCNEDSLNKLFHNDVYGNYEYFPQTKLNSLKATIIHPANDKLIEKYSVHPAHIIDEIPDIYNNQVLPYILKEQLNLQWVYNILEHKQESERILFEDPCNEFGFILIPDLKWNGTTLETLYMLAIVHAKDIKSLRDLTSNHLPLLKNIKNKGIAAIKDKYNLDSTRLRIYLHYQPSFYHLHVHFTYLQHDAPGIFAERAHLLTTVINNLESNSDYYKTATLPFVVHENNNLFEQLLSKGLVNRATKPQETVIVEKNKSE